MRLNEDIIRFLTIRINSIDEKPSALMNNKADRYKNELINSETVKLTNEEV
jgi:ribosomal protein S6